LKRKEQDDKIKLYIYIVVFFKRKTKQNKKKNTERLRFFWKLLEIHYTFHPDEIRCWQRSKAPIQFLV